MKESERELTRLINSGARGTKQTIDIPNTSKLPIFRVDLFSLIYDCRERKN